MMLRLFVERVVQGIEPANEAVRQRQKTTNPFLPHTTPNRAAGSPSLSVRAPLHDWVRRLLGRLLRGELDRVVRELLQPVA
eukprot:6614028-Prymnesium_polylepis.1